MFEGLCESITSSVLKEKLLFESNLFFFNEGKALLCEVFTAFNIPC